MTPDDGDIASSKEYFIVDRKRRPCSDERADNVAGSHPEGPCSYRRPDLASSGVFKDPLLLPSEMQGRIEGTGRCRINLTPTKISTAA
jgi:hypothetical protein